MKIHRDQRRTLYEFEYPVTKLLVMENAGEVGNHYHKVKEELFLLLAGEGVARINQEEFPLKLMEPVVVGKGVIHTFRLQKGSLLLGFCTHPYDSTDDYHSLAPPI